MDNKYLEKIAESLAEDLKKQYTIIGQRQALKRHGFPTKGNTSTLMTMNTLAQNKNIPQTSINTIGVPIAAGTIGAGVAHLLGKHKAIGVLIGGGAGMVGGATREIHRVLTKDYPDTVDLFVNSGEFKK